MDRGSNLGNIPVLIDHSYQTYLGRQIAEAARQDLINRNQDRACSKQSLDSRIAEVARLQSTLEAYETCEIPTPPEISKAYKKAIANAQAAYREQKEQELAAARAQLEELKSREQKREDVAKRIAELEEELG